MEEIGRDESCQRPYAHRHDGINLQNNQANTERRDEHQPWAQVDSATQLLGEQAQVVQAAFSAVHAHKAEGDQSNDDGGSAGNRHVPNVGH